MVGVAAGVIPDGDTWVEGPDVNNPVAETYTPEDRTFIAHTREDVPALLAEVERLRALLTVDEAMVERAARAYFEAPIPGEHDANLMSWDRFTTAFPHNADSYREETRAALDAALEDREEA